MHIFIIYIISGHEYLQVCLGAQCLLLSLLLMIFVFYLFIILLICLICGHNPPRPTSSPFLKIRYLSEHSVEELLKLRNATQKLK
jgi:hypothetical protein